MKPSLRACAVVCGLLALSLPAGVGRADALVSEGNGRRSYADFERCELPGDRVIQVFTYGEAPLAATPRDRFVAATARASLAEIARVADVPAAEVACHPIEAPAGDVEWEIDVRFSAKGIETKSVDVTQRNAALATSSGAQRCVQLVSEKVFCATAPQGSAVSTTMGRAVCARGACAQDRHGKWHCSRRAGGSAVLGPHGVQCEQGCYAPSSNQCRQV